MVDLTISIVTANNKELILDCLKSIYEDTNGLSTEIYVVINASSDDSEEAIRKSFPEVRLIVNEKKLGFTHNHNIVIRRSTGKYVLVLNDDTVILDGALKKMVDFMESSADVGILGPKILNPDGTLQWSCGRSWSHKFEYFKSALLSPFLPFLRKKHFRRTHEVSWVTGACFLMRSEAADTVKPFDENIVIYYEDGDLCYRMIQAGWKVVFYPEVEIIHYHGQTRKKHLARDTLVSYQSRLYFFSKHYGRLTMYLVRMLTILEAFLRWARAHISLGECLRRKDQKNELIGIYRRVIKLAIDWNSYQSWES